MSAASTLRDEVLRLFEVAAHPAKAAIAVSKLVDEPAKLFDVLIFVVI
jgi:hypothetical protein